MKQSRNRIIASDQIYRIECCRSRKNDELQILIP
jgi:hypothetical protein